VAGGALHRDSEQREFVGKDLDVATSNIATSNAETAEGVAIIVFGPRSLGSVPPAEGVIPFCVQTSNFAEPAGLLLRYERRT